MWMRPIADLMWWPVFSSATNRQSRPLFVWDLSTVWIDCDTKERDVVGMVSGEELFIFCWCLTKDAANRMQRIKI